MLILKKMKNSFAPWGHKKFFGDKIFIALENYPLGLSYPRVWFESVSEVCRGVTISHGIDNKSFFFPLSTDLLLVLEQTKRSIVKLNIFTMGIGLRVIAFVLLLVIQGVYRFFRTKNKDF